MDGPRQCACLPTIVGGAEARRTSEVLPPGPVDPVSLGGVDILEALERARRRHGDVVRLARVQARLAVAVAAQRVGLSVPAGGGLGRRVAVGLTPAAGTRLVARARAPQSAA